MNRGPNASKSVPYLLTAAGLLASIPMPSIAQQAPPTSYEVTENSVGNPEVAKENAGPVRMARFSFVKGTVKMRPTNSVDWSQAYVNQPIRQGVQIYVPNNSRVEIQFDDGSVVRLGGGAFITIQTLYSDQQGEFTEVKLNDGVSNWDLKNKYSVYQIDAACCSVKAAGPAKFRMGARKDCEVATRSGNCTVENRNGHTELPPGKYVKVNSIDEPMQMLPAPPDDDWERWSDDRDRVYDNGDPISRRYLPPDIALASQDLDSYGVWENDPHYGEVWYPRVSDVAWRPYHHGHWVWVDPFGWTWVGAEPWGWAPYHYGTWVHLRRGWGWRPGPAHQYWSPAVVSFSSYNGDVAWAPLAPEEVSYPSRLAVGFSGGDWSLFFSIGGCASYYPGPRDVCYQRAWNNVYVNRATYVTNYYGVGGRPLYASNYNSYMNPGAWTPRNARFGGGSVVAANRFGVSNQFNYVARNNVNVFQRGRAVGAPARGFAPAVGPSHVRPTLASLTPSHAFTRGAVPAATAALASRPLYRSALAPNVARTAPNFGSRLAANSPVHGMAGRPGFNGATKAGFPGRPGQPNIAGRPGFNAANRPGANALNRPGSFGKPGVKVPANVQAARKTLNAQNGRNFATTPRTNTFGHTATGKPQVRTGNPAVANNARRNTAQTHINTPHVATNVHRTNTGQHTAANRPSFNRNTNQMHTNQFAHRTTATPSNRVSRPSFQPQMRRNNGSFNGGGFANHNRPQHPSFNRPQHSSQPNFGGNRPGFGGGTRPNFGGGGGGSRPSFHQQPAPSAPRGGGGGNFNRGGGGGGDFHPGGGRPSGGPPAGFHPGGGGGGGHDRRGR